MWKIFFEKDKQQSRSSDGYTGSAPVGSAAASICIRLRIPSVLCDHQSSRLILTAAACSEKSQSSYDLAQQGPYLPCLLLQLSDLPPLMWKQSYICRSPSLRCSIYLTLNLPHSKVGSLMSPLASCFFHGSGER